MPEDLAMRPVANELVASRGGGSSGGGGGGFIRPPLVGLLSGVVARIRDGVTVSRDTGSPAAVLRPVWVYLRCLLQAVAAPLQSEDGAAGSARAVWRGVGRRLRVLQVGACVCVFVRRER